MTRNNQASLSAFNNTADAPSTPNTQPREINDADDIRAAVDDLIDTILTATTEADASGRVEEFLTQSMTIGVGRYSLQNQIALITQLRNRGVDYEDNAEHFAGFNTWLNEHNRHVKKGESGYKVIAPVTGPACPDCGNAPNYHDGNDAIDCPRAGEHPDEWDLDASEQWSEGVYYYSTATTFALQQTAPVEDADPEDVFTPEHDVDGSTDDAEEVLAALVDAAETGAFTGAPDIRVREVGAGRLGLSARGASGGGYVLLKKDRDAANQVRTMAHEIAHELLHQNTEQEVPDAVKEVEAEAVAFAVTEYLGFDVEGSELYIGSWLEHARDRGDVNDDETGEMDAVRAALKDRLRTVQDTAATIIETIEPDD